MDNKIQVRTIETRVSHSEEDGGLNKTITGFIPYNSLSEDMGFREIISPTAFKKTLADGFDVLALFGHESNKVLGRVSNQSLSFDNKSDGLYITCKLPVGVSYCEDAYNLIKQEYNSRMSFGFIPVKVDRVIDPKTGNEVDTIIEAALREVSFCVSRPAYAETDSEARHLQEEKKIDYKSLMNRALLEIVTSR